MSCDRVDFSKAFVSQAKGGTLTRVRAATTWRHLESFAREKKMILKPEKMTSKQLLRYVQWRQESGINTRTIQNEISHIRRALRGAGRDLGDIGDAKNNYGSARLEIEPGSRTNKAPPADVSLINGMSRADIQAACRLQAALGLRQMEAICSVNSLGEWGRALSDAQVQGRGAFVEVRQGTKGGRARTTFIPPSAISSALEAVRGAAALVQGGALVQGAGLPAARRAYARACADAGFSSHGLRRDFAVRQFLHYREAHPEKEALRRLSQDLGHGDGRGRWVKGNYLGALFNAED